MGNSDKTKFIELYSKEQKSIFLYILSMVHHRSDAEDLMQQTASEMWRMFDRFEEGSNFVAWGIAIAKYRILSYRKNQAKNRLFLSPEVYDQVFEEFKLISETSNKRVNALQGCLKKLNQRHNKMLRMHYNDGLSYRQIAEHFELSTSSVYKLMSKIYMSLRVCIKRTLVIWETNA